MITFNTWKNVPSNFSGVCKIKNLNAIIHYHNGKEHNLNGPAVIVSQTNYWYKEGKLHRLDGPAVQNPFSAEWYKEGRKHRLDGPAVTNSSGKEEYWIEGKELSKEDFESAPEVVNKDI